VVLRFSHSYPLTRYSKNCIPVPEDCRVAYTALPRYTESRIEQLCTEAKTAKTEGDAKGAVIELQASLAEHIGLARQSLEAQVSTLASLEAKNKDLEAKVKKSRFRRSRRG
jgi:hypothetical protein